MEGTMEKRTKKTSSLKSNPQKIKPIKLLEEGFSPELQSGIDSTVMAIRERLMGYFKGTYVESVAATNISLSTKSITTRRHYQVRNAQLKNTCYVAIDGLILLEVEKNPQKITLYMKTLRRSKPMTYICKEVEAFIGKYLRGVEVVYDQYNGTSNLSSPDDISLFINNKPRNNGSFYNTNIGYDPYITLSSERMHDLFTSLNTSI